MIVKTFSQILRTKEPDYISTDIKVVQGDVDVNRLLIQITDGVAPIDYDAVDHAYIIFGKPDKTVVQGELVRDGAGYVYDMGTNEIASPGRVLASVQLYGADGQRMTTARFRFEVIPDIESADSVESATEYTALQQAIALMEELEQKLEDFPNIKVLGTYPTLEDLETAWPDGSSLDGGFFVTSNGEFYIWSTVTSAWVSLGSIQGPKGDTGATGATGPKGDMPDHQWSDTSIRFENPDGSWGEYVNIKGADGTGTGDMTKAVYDTNDNGKVDDAEHAGIADSVPWSGVTGAPSFIPVSQKGTAGGVAELDESGKVLSTQLPSYVDEVLEYAAVSGFPVSGESGKIYVATDTNLTYRWTGSAYVEISPSLALGETSSTAYRGDRGKTAYDHSQITSGNPHGATAAQVGAVAKAGDTMTGSLVAKTGTDYTTKQVRNIRFKTSDFTTSDLANGEIGIVYE